MDMDIICRHGGVAPTRNDGSSGSSRVVIFSESNGVFLGTALGLGFWSKLESLDLRCAVTFGSELNARDFMSGWLMPPPDDVTIVPVEADMDGRGASVDACVRAGLPGWEVPAAPAASSPGESD